MNPQTSTQTSKASLVSSQGQLTTKEQRAGKRESVRSQIALYYVIGYFIIIMACMGIGFYKNFDVEGFKDFLLAISGILSGPLGFIIGFYFKESSSNDN